MIIRIVPSDQETLEEKKKRKQQKGKKRARKVAKRKTKNKGKDDRCTRIAKRKYDVWPSAYASGAVVKCRQGKIWKGISEGKEEDALDRAEEEVLDTLEDEGGAAGLEPLEKALSDVEGLPDDFEAEEFVEDIPKKKVKQHKHGDYIEMGGLKNEGEVVEFPTKERSSEAPESELRQALAMYVNYLEPQEAEERAVADALLLYYLTHLEEMGSKDEFIKYVEDYYEEIEQPSNFDFDKIKSQLEGNEVVKKAAASVADIKAEEDEANIFRLREAKKKRKKAGTESSKESSLHDWFKRKGAKGKTGGWVDCNAPDGKGGYKPCGRQKGEKRSKYPACRPTPGACKERGKGKTWGKKAKKRKKMKESAEEYVYGVKNPGRVANIYTIRVVKK